MTSKKEAQNNSTLQHNQDGEVNMKSETPTKNFKRNFNQLIKLNNYINYVPK